MYCYTTIQYYYRRKYVYIVVVYILNNISSYSFEYYPCNLSLASDDV